MLGDVYKFINDRAALDSRHSLICGPCAIESRDQMFEIAAFLKESNIKILRGGAYKPRTSPDSFQGIGSLGLEWMAEAAERYGLWTVSEIMDASDLPFFQPIDILQIGSRNMQNFTLLKKVGKTRKPILLKRGMMATVQEFLHASEYMKREGNSRIILCERGIRTFETGTRNTLDLSCVPILKQQTDYPVIVDLSHALGRRDIMPPLARASLACGADGLMLEVHPNPSEAQCDGQQSLTFNELTKLLLNVEQFLNPPFQNRLTI